MSAVLGEKLFGNRPTPALTTPNISRTHYEPDNETSRSLGRVIERLGAWSQAGGGGDAMPATFQMIARTFDLSKLAEPLLPAEPAPDALLRFGPLARRGAGGAALKAINSGGPVSPSIVRSLSSHTPVPATEESPAFPIALGLGDWPVGERWASARPRWWRWP